MLVPQCRGLCWGSCKGGISVGYQECSQHCGGTYLGSADRAGGSGLCLAGNKGWTAPTDHPRDAFSAPYPSLMSPTSSGKDFNLPLSISAQLCTPTTDTLPGFEDSGWGLGSMLGKSV